MSRLQSSGIDGFEILLFPALLFAKDEHIELLRSLDRW